MSQIIQTQKGKKKSSFIEFLKKECVLVIAVTLAILSSFISIPKLSYIDFKVLILLFNLMVVVAAFKELKVLDSIAIGLLKKCNTYTSISLALVFITFISSMIVTNDVALITFVPLSIVIARKANINVLKIVIFQTLAANLGSSFTPMGNPQNLFIYSFYNLSPIDFFKITLPIVILAVLFLVLLGPAMYGNSNYEIYYDIAGALPQSLDSAVANKKLEEKFNMNSTHIVLMKNGMASKEKSEMLKKIEDVKGVKWALGIDSFKGVSIPSSMIPKKLESKLKSDNYEIAFVCSDYKAATDEVNSQIADINKIVKKYSKDSMVIGEAPLTKDLQDVTDIDLVNVNYVSVAAIFLIILITFKSILIPVILVMVIEFAIFLNMSVPFYTHESLPFVASIVIGTIQLGATVDYAILMTSRYHKERVVRRKSKKEAIDIAHKTSIKSIMISGMCLFASTFGVTMSSSIDMIKSICTLLSRGAVISTIVVILVLPAMLTVFDKWICKTTWDMRKIDY